MMAASDNIAVAAKLELAADLLELTGADKYRFLSYRKAANGLRAWPEPVNALHASGRLTDVPGVGDKMAATVAHIVETGTFPLLELLNEQIPSSLAEVKRVPGIGPKRAMQLHERLGISSLDDLERALEDGSLARTGGLGERTAEKIASSLQSHRRHRARAPISDALPVSEGFLAELRTLPSVTRAEVAGSVRRHEETVGNIDVVAAVTDPGVLAREAAQMAVAERVTPPTSPDQPLVVEMHDGFEVRVHLTDPQRFGAALRHSTGSVAHNRAMEEITRHSGVDVSAGAPFAEEDEVYAALGMDTPPPEIRWGADEIDSARKHSLPQLVVLGDVLGDLQSHSTFTDGRSSLEENRRVAGELGYEYIAATDHAYALRMVGGLDLEDLERQWAQIDELNAERGTSPLVLKGIELNVAEGGRLDYDDEVLARFDIVLASLHSGWDDEPANVTRRMVAAMRHPLVDIIAHPTGRILGRRDPMPLDMEEVLAVAGETGTIMEINSYPDRLDLSAEHIRLARSFGVRFSLGTDAHDSSHLRFMPYGVWQARRGLVTRDVLLNAQHWDVGRTWLKRYRTLG